MFLLDLTNLHPKQHIDWFSILAQLTVVTSRQTHIHGDHATTVTIVRIELAMRPKMSQRLQAYVLARAKVVIFFTQTDAEMQMPQ